MTPRPTLPGRSAPAKPQDDWLEDLLHNDAQAAAPDGSDAGFVAATMARLDDPFSPPRPSRTVSVRAWGQRLLLGFEVLVLGAVCISAPAALQAWLNFAQAPLHVAALLHPDLLGFGAGVAMMVLGAIEWARHTDEEVSLTMSR